MWTFDMIRLPKMCLPLMRAFGRDRRGFGATEFAFLAPVMMTLFFGVVEFSSGVAVDRKVTLVARTLSDLTSQAAGVTDTDFSNFFAASYAIFNPYPSTPTKATISELYIDPTTLKARVQWSKGTSPRNAGDVVTIPSGLAVAGTYLIFSEVTYTYVPTVGYVMVKAGVTLSDVAYTRPRQSACVLYNTSVCPTS